MARMLVDMKQVSKRYSLHPQAGVRDATAAALRDGDFWALRNVDLRVDAGEVVGVIGHNGAGKSTLLNLVSGIVPPTTGSISIHTDKVCRIDQGAGLSTQETGRENIRMQLALHGVPGADAEAETEAIADFADLHEQLDAPVGTYSTGMRSRLGFAIYARLQPDLLLVDDGLGGGDQRFRERVRGFITDYVAGGGSMLIAMHDTSMIRTLCDRVLLLDGGRPVLTADATTAIDAYNRLAIERGLPLLPTRRPKGAPRAARPDSAELASDEGIGIDSISLVSTNGVAVHPGMRVQVVIAVRTTRRFDDVVPLIEISRGEIAPLATTVGPPVALESPGGTLCFTISFLPLAAGEYDVRIGFFDQKHDRRIGPTDGSERMVLRVEPAGGRSTHVGSRGGPLHLPVVWETGAPVHPVAADAAAFHDNPYPTYRRWLAEPGPFYSQLHGAWIVSRHDQVSAILRDSVVTNRTVKNGVLGDTMLARDPPDHGRLRGLIAGGFAPSAIRALEGRIGTLVDELIDGLAGLERFDFIARFADRLAGRVITDILGLPAEDLPMLLESVDMSGGPEVVGRRMGQMREYFARVVDRRRSRPGDDLVTSILAAHDPGGNASIEEVLGTCVLLLLAGYETASSLLGNGLLLLMRHPLEYARLRDCPALVDTAIEEMLRVEGPTHYGTRRAATDTIEVGGRSIAAGARIMVCFGAANRDPSVFPDPDRFDIGRTPNRHLAFGFGIHACPGAALSRTQARIAFTRLNERLGELTFDVEAGAPFVPHWRPGWRARGLYQLPVRRRAVEHDVGSAGAVPGA